jgi:hypothetical protein
MTRVVSSRHQTHNESLLRCIIRERSIINQHLSLIKVSWKERRASVDSSNVTSCLLRRRLEGSSVFCHGRRRAVQAGVSSGMISGAAAHDNPREGGSGLARDKQPSSWQSPSGVRAPLGAPTANGRQAY